MSVTYSDLPRTSFPDALDTMTPVSDLNYANKALADQYYTYLNAGNFTAAQQLLTDNPTLETMIINAAKINKYQDIALALERFFKNDVEGYLETRFAYIGTYASGTTYVKGNIVDMNGEGFICRVTSSVDVSPTSHTTTTNWAIIAQQGIQGVSGTGLAPRGTWNSSVSYYVNDCIAHNNALWQCLVANSSSEPTSSNTNWTALLNLNISWDNLIGKPPSFTPTAHKSTHATGGTDALTAADVGAAAASHAHGNVTSAGQIGGVTLDSTLVRLVSGALQTLGGTAAGMQIATGSYTGTGTSGSSSPNSIAIGFSTKLLLIQQVSGDTNNCWQALLFINPATKGNLIGIITSSGGDASASTVTWGLTNVSWYANNAIYQFNITGVTYNYFSVG